MPGSAVVEVVHQFIKRIAIVAATLAAAPGAAIIEIGRPHRTTVFSTSIENRAPGGRTAAAESPADTPRRAGERADR